MMMIAIGFLFFGFIVFILVSQYFDYLDSFLEVSGLSQNSGQKKGQPPLVGFPGDYETRLEKNYRGHLALLETVPRTVGEGRRVFTTIALSRYTPLEALTDSSPEALAAIIDDLAAISFPHLPLEQSVIPLAKFTFNRRSQALFYEQPNVVSYHGQIEQLLDPLCQILGLYLTTVALGGAAMPALGQVTAAKNLFQPHITPTLLQQIVSHLITEIAQDTREQCAYKAPRLLCPHCLTRFRRHTLHLSWLKAVDYYGCRLCHQNHEFWEGRVLAVLDHQMTTPYSRRQDIIRLNWLARRQPADLDGVYIVRATDEEVERFAVQIGNDTDPLRRNRYPRLPCTIAARCALNENTLRILRRMFGQVTLKA